MTETKRMDWFTRAVAVSFLLGIGFSGSLWLSGRLYPLVPFLGLIGRFLPLLDYAVFGVLIALLCAIIVRPRSQTLKFALLALLAILFLQDQNRLWPSFYEFSLFFLVLASMRSDADGYRRGASRALATSQFILAAVYFWSGVLKLTPQFYQSTFPWFLSPITAYTPFVLPYLPTLAVFAAAAEALFALALLTKRFRNVALWEATGMHVLIFFLIGPLRGNWNDSAWLWSAATCVFLWLLFYKTPPFEWRIMFGSTIKDLSLAPVALVVLLVGILPALNLVNAWPSSLSFNVYTGNTAVGEMVIESNVVPRLPVALRPFVVDSNSGSADIFDINAWSASTFNANIVPSKNIFLALLNTVCSYASAPSDVQLIYQEKSGWGIPVVQSFYTCSN